MAGLRASQHQRAGVPWNSVAYSLLPSPEPTAESPQCPFPTRGTTPNISDVKHKSPHQTRLSKHRKPSKACVKDEQALWTRHSRGSHASSRGRSWGHGGSWSRYLDHGSTRLIVFTRSISRAKD